MLAPLSACAFARLLIVLQNERLGKGYQGWVPVKVLHTRLMLQQEACESLVTARDRLIALPNSAQDARKRPHAGVSSVFRTHISLSGLRHAKI